MDSQSAPGSPADLPLVAEESVMSLDEILSCEPLETARPSSSKATWPLPAVIVGAIVGIAEDGMPLVDFCENKAGRPLAARSTAAIDLNMVGCEVALLFEGGDLARPIILGMIQQTVSHASAGSLADELNKLATPIPAVEATADGQRVTITAEQEIELRCGKASITLTRAGKVLIRGAYLLSRSSGVNRIKGGSVQIN